MCGGEESRNGSDTSTDATFGKYMRVDAFYSTTLISKTMTAVLGTL